MFRVLIEHSRKKERMKEREREKKKWQMDDQPAQSKKLKELDDKIGNAGGMRKSMKEVDDV